MSSDQVNNWEYLTIPEDERGRLGGLGAEGWELVARGGDPGQSLLYFKRPAPTFRERVTLEQRSRYLASRGHPTSPQSPLSTKTNQLPNLNPALTHLLATTGHTDYFTICDRGFPVPDGPERIDLALTDGIPTVLDVLRVVAVGWTIDRVLVTHEMAEVSPGHIEEIEHTLGDILIERVSHLELKRLAQGGRATVRTGDTVPYANIIVVSG